MPSILNRLAGLGAGTAVLAATAVAWAHPDDPKEKDRQPPYQGPGYRAALDDGDGPPVTFPSMGVQLLAWMPLNEFPGGHSTANDCWGYVSPSGREYAILGLQRGSGYVEVTNPGNPQLIGVITGPSSTWHDVKTYGEYAYVVSEAGSGIQVVDLTQIDNGVVTHVRDVTTGGSATHNVAINEDTGFLYRTGGSGNGLLIYDLNANPTNPPLVGSWPLRYTHDAQIVTMKAGPWAGREIAFCSNGSNGGFCDTGLDILDVTDKGNIQVLSCFVYPNPAYSHQGWLSEDQQYFYLNDELDENGSFPSTVHVIDVSDLTNPGIANSFDNGNPAITHNLYVRDNLIFAANYRSGLRVFDIGIDPLNPPEVAYFDTYPENDAASFNSLWSNYPLLPSGIVLGSDVEKGLFVWSVSEPVITFNFPAGLPQLVDPGGETLTVQIEELQPGGLNPGTGTFHYDVGQGWQSTPLVSAGGDMYEATLPAAVCPGDVEFYFTAEGSDLIVVSSPPNAPSASYSATAAFDIVTVFEDNMQTNPGYTVNSISLTDGEWERGVPIGGGGRGDPATDFDGSGACWLTANREGNSDVDGGPTQLTTVALDLSNVNEPYISYARWFTNNNGDDDRLNVYVSNGGTWQLVESVVGGAGWEVNAFRVSDFVVPSSSVRLRFDATDNPNDSVTEGAIDALKVIEYVCIGANPADVNGDGVVNVLDLLAVLGAWGPCAACPEDINGDGVVNVFDLLEVLDSWG